jgi:hypothetical protein
MHVGEMEGYKSYLPCVRGSVGRGTKAGGYFELLFDWWRLGPIGKNILFYLVLHLFPLSQNPIL